MAGIYIHIPFCSAKCYYCDFYSRANCKETTINTYIDTLCSEIELQKDYLSQKSIETIYFGGGTPSLLRIKHFEKIFTKIFSIFKLMPENEITLEVNPEDTSKEFFSNLKNNTPINRISIGTQSFDDNELKLMNRRNVTQKNFEAINNAFENGFDNLSIDLIYGLPNQTINQWEKNLEISFSLPIKHISAYCLSIEPNTVFGRWLETGKIKETEDEITNLMYEMLMDKAEENNFEHYEISNFCKQNYESKHNSSYWFGKEYLGVGASAHSYNKISRQWNVSNINNYIEFVNKNEVFYETEELTQRDFFNEYLLTHLRTSKGLDIDLMKKSFNNYFGKIENLLYEFINEGLLLKNNTNIFLTRKGKFLSDTIIRKLYTI